MKFLNSITMLIVSTIAVVLFTYCSSNANEGSDVKTNETIVLPTVDNVTDGKTTAEETPEIIVKPVEKATDITEADFDATISNGVTLVDFWAAWCAPCRIQGPIIDELAKETGHTAKITKLDVDKNRNIAARFNITSIPSILVFKDGKLMLTFVGVQQKDFLAQQIKQLL